MLISQESAELISSEISTIMCKSCFLVNEEGAVIASTDSSKFRHTYPKLIPQLRQEQSYVVLENSLNDMEDICFPVRLRSRIVGAVGVVSPKGERSELVTHYSGIIERIAEVRIQRLSRRMSRDEEQAYRQRAQQIFFESILFSGTLSDFLHNDDEMAFRANLLGIDLAQPRIFAVINFEFDQSWPDKPAASEQSDKIGMLVTHLRKSISKRDQVFCFVDNQCIVILFCSNLITQVLENAAQLCGELENFYGAKIYCGISSVAACPAQFQRCYVEAQTACSVAQQADWRKPLAYDVTSLHFIVQALPLWLRNSLSKAVFDNLSEKEVQEITEVIRSYMKYDGNIEQTAAALFIHRNTLLYRIKKIRTLTGFNLKNPADFLILYLAVSNIRDN